MQKKKNNNLPKYAVHKYTVVQFDEEEEKLFECIPDRWFVNEDKTECYWPPATGTAFKVRAIRCEKPDDSWSVYGVTVVSEGHLTYNSGFKVVQDKCNQKYNTSSAEEQIEAANYRRKHPVLAMEDDGTGSIENIFRRPKNTAVKEIEDKSFVGSSSEKSDSISNCAALSSNDTTLEGKNDRGVVPNNATKEIKSSNQSQLSSRSSSLPRRSDKGETNPSASHSKRKRSHSRSRSRGSGPRSSRTRSRSSGTRSHSSGSRSSGARSCSSRARSRSSGTRSRSRGTQSRSSGTRSRSRGTQSRSSRTRSRSRGTQSRSSGTRSRSSGARSRSSGARSRSSGARSRSSGARSRSSGARSRSSRARSRSNGTRSRSNGSKSNRASRQRSRSSSPTNQIQSHSNSGTSNTHRSRSNSMLNHYHHRQWSMKSLKGQKYSSKKQRLNRSSSRSSPSKLNSTSRSRSNSFLTRCAALKSVKRKLEDGFPSKKLKQCGSTSGLNYDRNPLSMKSIGGSERMATSGLNTNLKPNSKSVKSGMNTKTPNERIVESESGPLLNYHSSRSASVVNSTLSPSIRFRSNVNTSNKNRHGQTTSHYSRHQSFRSPSIESISISNKFRSNACPSKQNVPGTGTDLAKHKSRLRQHGSGSYYQQKNNSDATSNCCSTTDLLSAVQRLDETINQFNRRLDQNDRRMHRMELTVNKIFIVVGELNGTSDTMTNDPPNDRGFDVPELPIQSTNELAVMKRRLKDKDFVEYFLQIEKAYCCPTKKSTDTITISKYLSRFITLRVRSKLTLKEGDGATLYKDYRQVYDYLIAVMQAGYKSCKKSITVDDAHSALRIVWGRSKQYYRDEQERKLMQR